MDSCRHFSLNAYATHFFPLSFNARALSTTEIGSIAKPTNTLLRKSQNMLNLRAKVFFPKRKPHDKIGSISSLNASARVFVPQPNSSLANTHPLQNITIRWNYAVIALYLTCLFLAYSLVQAINMMVMKDPNECNPKEKIRKLKLANPSKIILAYLNLNSIRFKFECLRDIIGHNIDILLI